LTPTCRACEGARLESILDLGQLPLAGGFLSGREDIANERFYPLEIHGCVECGLIQIPNPIDPNILFQDYSFSSSTIKPLIDHFEGYAEWMARTLGPRKVVEFGCNDGVLLAPLGRRGITAIGVDISRNITDMARDKGLTVETGFFDVELARSIRSQWGPVDVVTGSNVFAHNQHPGRILEAALEVLKENGHLCLEFMYAGDLLEQLQWDTLYHEHLTFYSLSTISILLERYGFRVVYAERLPMHGGSLRICASCDPSEAVSPAIAQLMEWERDKGLSDVETWHKFSCNCWRKINIVKEVFDDLSKAKNIWAYGAAGKATMWVNACKMDYLGGVVDASPLRAGKLMPGTHTPIVTPEAFRATPPDIMCVTAWNYADHIRAKESWFQGTWATPLPDLRFL
jgi:novobiocin biosynthesis protein NovU/D-mycarose 3-C-methyltransferase